MRAPPASWALGALVLSLLALNVAPDSEAESAYPITHEKQPVGARQARFSLLEGGHNVPVYGWETEQQRWAAVDAGVRSARESSRDRWILRWKGEGAEDLSAQGEMDGLCSEAHGGPPPGGGEEVPPRFRGTCLARFTHVFQGLSGRFLDGDMANLVAAYGSRIAYVQRAQLMRKASTWTQNSAVWGLARLSADALPSSISDGSHAYTYSARGTGVHAYVVDSGILATHAEFVDDANNSRVSLDFYGNNTGQTTAGDCDGHGTHVAASLGGRTYGVAKDVMLHAVRVIDCSGYADDDDVVAGLDWVLANHVKPAVAQMAVGGGWSVYVHYHAPGTCPCPGREGLLHFSATNDAVAALHRAGVPVSIAAGNDARDACLESPTWERLGVSVAASTQMDGFAWFSNWGNCVDLAAPGKDIKSIDGSTGDPIIWDGTSMASPYVAGLLALYLEKNPTAGSYQAVAQLLESAHTGRITGDLKTGTPNVLAHSALVFSDYSAVSPIKISVAAGDLAAKTVSVALAAAPPSAVTVAVTLNNDAIGTVSPSSITFSTGDWSTARTVTFTPAAGGYNPGCHLVNYIKLAFSGPGGGWEFTQLVGVEDSRPLLGETWETAREVGTLPFTEACDTVDFSNSVSHTECSNNDGGSSPEVWYKIVPSATAVHTISLCGSSFDTKLVVYTADGIASSESLMCDEDSCEGTKASTLDVTLTQGAAYYFAVDGWDGEKGTYTLAVSIKAHVPPSPPPPPLLPPGAAAADSNVTIGTGAGTTHLTGPSPFGSYYHDDRTELIYLASELAAAGVVAQSTFTRIAFHVTTGQLTLPLGSFSVTLAHTADAAALTSRSPALSSATTVYTSSGEKVYPGWKEFWLTTPFVWDGESNVVVKVCFDGSSTSHSAAVTYTETSDYTVFSSFSNECVRK